MDFKKSVYEKCNLCPRKCGTDRLAGKTGFCKAGADSLLSCAMLHHGEEPPVTGNGGSGTLFFAGCTLKCGFCQNHQLSHGMMGSTVKDETLADIMAALQEGGAENINLVTATHFIPSVAHAVSLAKKKGLVIPILWNTSGYETEESVEMLLDFVDVFLPDLKTLDPALSARLFRAGDYPEYAAKAVLKMAEGRKTDFELIEKEGIIRSGIIVRHLVLPGEIASTRQFLRWYSENLMEKAMLSLMFQYEPDAVSSPVQLPGRRVSGDEVAIVYNLLDEFDIEEGFIQETDEETEWVPDFEKTSPFPGSKKDPIWHWREGFGA